MKKLLYPFLVLVAVIIASLWYFLVYADNKNNSSGDDSITKTVESFTVRADYKQNSTWEYTVTGELPTPCHNAVADALVAESYPEQVTIQVAIVEPETDTMCAQVIQTFEYTGEFSASEKAAISLRVN